MTSINPQCPHCGLRQHPSHQSSCSKRDTTELDPTYWDRLFQARAASKADRATAGERECACGGDSTTYEDDDGVLRCWECSLPATPPADDASGASLPVDVAVGRAIKAAVAEHTMGTETSGGVYEMGHGMFGAYHWCACGWRSDDGPWRDPAEYVRGMAQAKIDHLSNAVNAAVREVIR